MQRAALIVCRILAGFASLFVTAYGVYVYAGTNLRMDTLLVSLYCFVPMLSFPVFLLSFWRHRLSVALHAAMAIAFLIAYSMLNWRTCAEIGYCVSVAITVLETLSTRPSEATLAVVLFNLTALLLNQSRKSKT